MKENQSTGRSAFVRGFIEGAASLFDIFGVRAQPKEPRSPEDDARNLQEDIERIGRDFQTVLSSIDATYKR